ncbi:hypothetical protein [Croceitalea rosinachiae]|uniref:Uncharacterized protein n=1 Tax=Croceitalea rosinachiae TaxID=3075596 RepID=A0ABU3AAJ7_9FLAO|nr:hypothetical protein [Croceitalea sp. F388]MDT0606918.1 hypothetical protein [Croceitalea sp. F388]
MDSQKELKNLIDKLMIEDSLDSPSTDFTKNVIARLPIKRNSFFVYKPLLPKSIFVLAVALIVAVTYFVLNSYGLSEIDQSYLNRLNVVGTSVNDLFSQFRFSKTVVYIIIFAGLMFCIQTILLKRHFDSRIA